MRWVGKGFSGVETPLFKGMLAARIIAEEGLAEEQVQADDAVAAAVQETVAEDIATEAIPSTLTLLILPSPPSHDIPSLSQVQSSPPQQPQSSPQAPPQTAQTLEIIKLKARIKRLERANKVKSSKLRRLKKVRTSQQIESSDAMKDVFNQGRMIDDLDKDEGIELAEKQAEIYHLDLDHSSKVLSMQEDDSEVQEVVKVVTTAKLITEVVTAATSQAEKQAEIYNLDLDHPSKVLNVVTAATSQVSAASATISTAKPSIPATALTVVAAYTRRRKGVIIRDPEEELSSKTHAETLGLKDKGKGILIESPKPMKKKDQIELDAEYARKLHEEINKDTEEINKDIDWDAAIDHVKQQSMGNRYIKRYHGMKKKPQTERFGIVLLGKEEEIEVDVLIEIVALKTILIVILLMTLLLEYLTFDLLSMIDKHSRADAALRIRDEDTDEVKIDRGGSLSSQILAVLSKEKGNSNNLTVVFGTSGCRNVDATLLKKQRWLCGSCLPPSECCSDNTLIE
nr:hypothetical protein [Tanacetum cinerariifolium]